MNILITGTNGFLGGATYKFLSHKHNVFPISSVNFSIRYTNDYYNLFNKIQKIKPDVIINFGWGGGSNSKDLDSIEQFDNIKTCIDLFNFGIDVGVKRFIGVGSSWEDSWYGHNNYGYCKTRVREIWERMSYTTKTYFNWVVPYWIYGPNDKENRFIPSIIKKCLNNEKIELHPAQNLVDYLYIDDFVSAVEKVLENGVNTYSNYNLCSGHGYKIQDLVEKIKSLTNSKSVITYDKEYPENFNMEWIGNSDKLKNMDWKEKFTLEEGLIKTIEWHKTK